MFSGKSRWRMVFSPSAVFPGDVSLCEPLEKETVAFVDQETGQEVKSLEKSGFRSTTGEEAPSVKELDCFVIKKEQVKRIE